MSNFNWFRLIKLARECADSIFGNRENAYPILPVAPKTDLVAEKLKAALTEIWQFNGGLQRTITKGTLLWHGGTVPTFSKFDANRALWCTSIPSKSSYYDGFARTDALNFNAKPENSNLPRLRPFRLDLTTERALELADFGGASLLQFAEDHCNSQHNEMKIALREWCLAHHFDGVENINTIGEIVICNPTQDLRILKSHLL